MMPKASTNSQGVNEAWLICGAALLMVCLGILSLFVPWIWSISILFICLFLASAGWIINHRFYQKIQQVNYERKILSSFPETNPNPVIAVNAEGGVLYANPAARQTCIKYFNSDDVLKLFPDVVKQRFKAKCNFSRVRYQFNKVAFEYNFTWLPQFDRYHGYVREITHRMQNEKKLFNLAYFDQVTGLPNRTMFEKKLEELFLTESSQPSALALIDLDQLQRLASISGHKSVDEGIKQICQRWDDYLQPSFLGQAPTMYRLDSSYFAVVFSEQSPEYVAQIYDWLKNLQESLKSPIIMGAHQFYLTCCIGVVLTREINDKTSGDLIRYADIALMEAKSQGSSIIYNYKPKIEKEQHRKMIIEHELRQAIITHDFILHYQPKYRLSDNQIMGCEALLRWKNGENILMPSVFIDIAEQSGLIVQLTPWLIEQACKVSRSLYERMGRYLPVAINLSSQQFMSHTLVDTFQYYLQEYQLPGKAICIEITEKSALKSLKDGIKLINQLKSMGIIIALDDFGTGYSSLGYLQQLLVDILKIERRFIEKINLKQNSQVLVKAILALAKQFDLKVVGEGIETEQENQYLLEMGCDQGQGYLYGKPMSVDDLYQFIEARRFGT